MPGGMSIAVQRAFVRHGAPRCALCDVTLAIAPGEQVALIGPSGAGKSTLLAVMGAAQRPEQGTVSIDGKDPWSLGGAELRGLRRELFIAPQVPPLPPRQRVVHAVLAGRLPHWSLGQALRSLVRPGEAGTARDALAAFSLEHKLWEHVDRLSGGERQRVGLARAMVSQARLLLLDEPLSALDPTLGRQSLRALTSAARDSGATLVCSLHHVEIALANFPRIIGLRDGSAVFDRPPAQISAADIERLYRDRDDPGPLAETAFGATADNGPAVAARCF